jgi:hypothetical protein
MQLLRIFGLRKNLNENILFTRRIITKRDICQIFASKEMEWFSLFMSLMKEG